MTTEEKIKEIHNSSDLFGSVIEAGCAATIANTLMGVSGATNTVFFSLQPYSKKIQQEIYPETAKFRSVSDSFINIILNNELNKHKDINFCIAASFQLTPDTDEDHKILTHGWIGMKWKNVVNDYCGNICHISIPDKLTREEYLKIIAKIAIDIIYSRVNFSSQLKSNYIDNYYEIADKKYWKTETAKKQYKSTFRHKSIIDTLNIIDEENFIVLNSSTDDPIRFEDFCRGNETIYLQKGSFNPFHSGHLAVHNSIDYEKNDAISAFVISLESYDKPTITPLEALSRAIGIFNYFRNNYADGEFPDINVIICKKYLYLDNIKWIRKKWKQKINFLIGNDVAEKIYNDPSFEQIQKEKDVQFTVFNRLNFTFNENSCKSDIFVFQNKYVDTGISSTAIRNGLIENKHQ